MLIRFTDLAVLNF